MDERLMKLVFGEAYLGNKGLIKSEFRVRYTDAAAGEIEVEAATGAHRYMLRPLDELYDSAREDGNPDPLDDRFMPLFVAIEQSILRYEASDRALADAGVSLALERLGMKPEGDVGNDRLAQALQADLRLALSIGAYTRQEVRGALRKIGKSVARHAREGGPRGYLSFIRRHLRR